MRQRFIAMLIGSSALALRVSAQAPPEKRFPEIVYYADAYADHYHVPRALVHAFITQESGWNRTALSNKGASGLMQLTPATASRFAVRDTRSISENLRGGVQYLALLTWMFRGDLRLVTAAYYCGEHHIQRRGLSYQNPEVITYVLAVQRLYNRELQYHQNVSHQGVAK